MKRTVIFTDIALVPTFVLTFYSAHQANTWPDMAPLTKSGTTLPYSISLPACSSSQLVSCTYVRTPHGTKGCSRKALGKKAVSHFGQPWPSSLPTSTGIVLLGVEGANSGIGMWHYRIGLTSSALMLIHISKRFIPLCSSLRKKH